MVIELAESLGFALCGIADARPSDYADQLRDWLAAGKHGQMRYLADHAAARADPASLLDHARSIVAVADFYPTQPAAPPISPAPSGAAGRIARYAWGDDYHKTIKKRLFALADALRERHPDAAFRCVVDTAPIPEREHAARAGLGWVGKHTLLIHPRHGSWMLIGLVLTTLELNPSERMGWPARTAPPADHCGTCTRCIDACPTGCITPYSVDASRCISYLTIEHRSLIDGSLHEPMGDWVAGCDVCQEVCPHNQREGREALPMHPAYAPRPPAPTVDLGEVLGWTEDDRRAAFTRSALKRIKLDMFKRNALIAAGNHLSRRDDPGLRQRIEQIAADADEPALVRETAQQVLMRLLRQPGPAGRR